MFSPATYQSVVLVEFDQFIIRHLDLVLQDLIRGTLEDSGYDSQYYINHQNWRDKEQCLKLINSIKDKDEHQSELESYLEIYDRCIQILQVKTLKQLEDVCDMWDLGFTEWFTPFTKNDIKSDLIYAQLIQPDKKNSQRQNYLIIQSNDIHLLNEKFATFSTYQFESKDLIKTLTKEEQLVRGICEYTFLKIEPK